MRRIVALAELVDRPKRLKLEDCLMGRAVCLDNWLSHSQPGWTPGKSQQGTSLVKFKGKGSQHLDSNLCRRHNVEVFPTVARPITWNHSAPCQRHLQTIIQQH